MPPTMPKGVPNAMMGRHLGRKPPTDQQRRRAIPLRPFVQLAGRPVPPTDDYAAKAQECLTKMMHNDREGCCVATALAKLIGMANANRSGGKVIVATDAEVSRFYHAVGGPGDNGLYSPDALNFARDKGYTIGGQVHKIVGFAAVDVTDSTLLDAAFHWFQGLYYGVNLTSQQYNHAEDSDTWDVDGTSIIGGHAIPFSKRDPTGGTLATWSRQPKATRRLMQSRQWADECYVIFGPDWFDAQGADVNKVNVEALTAALQAVAAGGTPDIPDDPNPPGPTPPGPTPPGPMPHEWSHTFELFGYALRVYAGYEFNPTMATTRKVDYWKLAQDVWAFGKAVEQKDWQGVFTSGVAILADLGITLPVSRMRAAVEGLKESGGESPYSKLPTGNSLDTPTDSR